MGSVLHSLDLSGRSDQKVSWEAERASRLPQAKMSVRYPAHASTQGLEAQEAKRCFHAEVFIEILVRIADQHEWNVLLIRPDRLCGGMEDDDLFDTRRLDLASASAQLSDMRIADWAIHEPPELQMDETVRGRDLDRLASDRFQSCSRNDVACFEFAFQLRHGDRISINRWRGGRRQKQLGYICRSHE